MSEEQFCFVAEDRKELSKRGLGADAIGHMEARIARYREWRALKQEAPEREKDLTSKLRREREKIAGAAAKLEALLDDMVPENRDILSHLIDGPFYDSFRRYLTFLRARVTRVAGGSGRPKDIDLEELDAATVAQLAQLGFSILHRSVGGE